MFYKRQHFKKGQRLTADSMNQVDKWLAHICGKEIVSGEVNADGELELKCKDGETICRGAVGGVDPDEVTTLVNIIIAEAKANGEFGVENNNYVTAYGAKGDGKTDDTAAFKNALAENRIVFVPGGTYKLTSGITIGDNCCLELAQDAVLNFTNTTGNCITLGMLSHLKGNHATIKVPYEFSGNVLYAYSNDHTDDERIAVPPFTQWDPQWKAGRYVTDVNICKADSRGFHYAVEPEDCKGTAVYISADNTQDMLTFMWGVHYSGLRIAGAFAYGIHCKNIDDGWNHEMRIDAFIDACEIGVQLEHCNQVYVSATVQPRRAYSIDEVYAPYAKHGIKLVNSKNVDLSGSRVWDWENEDKASTPNVNEKMTLWSDGGEYQSYAMIGNCTGAILNDFVYHTKGDTRKRIYTDSDINLDTMTILQEPIDRYFKVINDEPYYSDGIFEHKLITQDHLDKHFDTGIIKNFTDLLPTAIDTDGSIYNGIGYKKNTRINVDGSIMESGYYVSTGFIPCVAGSEIYAHDMSFSKGDDNCRVIFYDKNFNVIKYGTNNENWAAVNRGLLIKNGNTYVVEYTELADGFKITVNGGQYGPHKNTAYARFVIYKTVWGENPMVAVDEQIAYTVEGFLSDGIKVKGENVIGDIGVETPDWVATKELISGGSVLLPQQSINFTSASVYSGVSFTINTGLKYDIYWNGEHYRCIAFEQSNGEQFLGNADLQSVASIKENPDSNKNAPFLFFGSNDRTFMLTKNTSNKETVTLKVETGVGYEYNKMPPEYLPHGVAMKTDIPEDGGNGMHIGADEPTDGSTLWIDTDEEVNAGGSPPAPVLFGEVVLTNANCSHQSDIGVKFDEALTAQLAPIHDACKNHFGALMISVSIVDFNGTLTAQYVGDSAALGAVKNIQFFLIEGGTGAYYYHIYEDSLVSNHAAVLNAILGGYPMTLKIYGLR